MLELLVQKIMSVILGELCIWPFSVSETKVGILAFSHSFLCIQNSQCVYFIQVLVEVSVVYQVLSEAHEAAWSR